MSWTYDEFLAELKSIGYKVPDVPARPKKNSGIDRHPYGIETGGLILMGDYDWSDPWERKPAFVLSWQVGGVRGGGYWGTKDQESYTTGDPEPEWNDLVNVLEHFCPNISYLRFRGVMTKTKTTKHERNDYYANSTIYSVRYIFLEDLYEHLRDHDLFEKQPVDDSE